MAKMNTYKCIETFQLVTCKKITIEKGQVIPEDFFTKNFSNSQKQIDILLSLKKIKKEGAKDEKVITKSNTDK